MPLPLPPLTKTNRTYLERCADASGLRSRQLFAELQSQERAEAIARWYREGGEWFLQWVTEHYRLENGEKLNWAEPYHPEFYRLMGNPWIESQVYEKGSQVGYTVGLIALNAFLLTAVKIPTGLGFETERKLRRMIPRIQRSFDYIEPLQRAKEAVQRATRRKDVDNKEYQVTVAGVTGSFFYASTQSKDKNQRQASSSMSSFTSWVMCCDEIELFPEGALDVAIGRQAACPMDTKPLRTGSTPGAIGGMVDSLVKSSHYLFQWSVQCPECGDRQFLDPFGNLLKPVLQESEDGGQEEVFLDAAGKPLAWFCRDRSSKTARIKTAYVGCQKCDAELTFQSMQYAFAEAPESRGTGYFACRNTGVLLNDLLAKTVLDCIPIKEQTALRLPRLASALFSPTDIIRKLSRSRNPAAIIQEGLGVAVSVGGGKMSLTRLQKCVGRDVPDWCHSVHPVRVLGIDQGAASLPSILTEWYLDPDEVDPETRWLNAYVNVLWWGDIYGFDGVDVVAKERGVDLIGVDFEPERQIASTYARRANREEKTMNKRRVSDQYPQEPDGSYRIDLLNIKQKTLFDSFLESVGWGVVRQEAISSATASGTASNQIRYFVRPLFPQALSIRSLDLQLRKTLSATVFREDPIAIAEQHAENFKVFLFDQVSLKGEDFRRAERDVQGEIVAIYALHRTAGLDWVRNRAYRQLMGFPEGTTYNASDDDNIFRHFLASDRRNDGNWVQTPGIPDHYHHAANFAEAAVLVSLYQPKPKRTPLAYGSIRR